MRVKNNPLLVYGVLIFFSLIIFIPFVWGVLSSFKTKDELSAIPATILPETFAWENYRHVVSTGFFFRDNFNSFIIASVSTALTILICSLAGYGLTKFRFKGQNAIFIIFLGTMMIPVQTTMIPVFILTSRMGMLNTYRGIILPLLANAYGIFLMRQFMLTIPDALIEASRIDGCPEFKIFFRIAVPLAKPAIGTLSILTFLGGWNSFLWPLILLSKSEMSTVQIGLRRFQGEYSSQGNYIMAAAILAVIPVAIVFVLFQRYIVEGISTSGLKE
jgi:ABC-type glycerol-3-phosphate transport system permease component